MEHGVRDVERLHVRTPALELPWLPTIITPSARPPTIPSAFDAVGMAAAVAVVRLCGEDGKLIPNSQSRMNATASGGSARNKTSVMVNPAIARIGARIVNWPERAQCQMSKAQRPIRGDVGANLAHTTCANNSAPTAPTAAKSKLVVSPA